MSVGSRYYGWFDDVTQKVATYDPWPNPLCAHCDKPVESEAMCRTFNIMTWAYAKRSYFYFTHCACDDASRSTADAKIFNMIKVNGD